MRDLILEGVKPSEVDLLVSIERGTADCPINEIRRLEVKGWIDVLSGIPIVTLTGRALLDAHKANHRLTNIAAGQPNAVNDPHSQK